VNLPRGLLLAWLLGSCASLVAQVPLLPAFVPPEGRVQITERSDFSRYTNGRYDGHTYREARLSLERRLLAGGITAYDGEVLILQETLRDLRASARQLDASQPVSFRVGPSGLVSFQVDEGYPILRGFPLAPPQPASQGQRWTGQAVVVVRPRADQAATRVPVLVEYEYAGVGVWAGQPAFIIKARYAIRYRGGDRLGDPAMLRSEGGRNADIYVSQTDGSTLFIRESLDETYGYADGSTIRLSGFILHFHQGSLPGDRDRIAALLGHPGGPTPGSQPGGQPGDTPAPTAPPGGGATAPGAPATNPPSGANPPTSQPATPPPFELGQSDRGLVLLLYDLRFVADSDQLLAGEGSRLEAIAAALRALPGRSFLVEGHTAAVGTAESQYDLSVARAKRIVDELVARGVPAASFVYRGLGGSQPIAANDTEQNRARNRRVEITILE